MQAKELEISKEMSISTVQIERRIRDLDTKIKFESESQTKEYYLGEMARKDQVIDQQRSIIRALSQKSISDIKSPTWKD